MREFMDSEGVVWVASVEEREGLDYKGRFCFKATPKDGPDSGSVGLEDVCWNSRQTAERTLQTMAESELQRRLRWAQGRAV